MKESSTYQAILEEGAVTELKKVLRRLGDKNFGPPDPSTLTALEGIADLTQLEELFDHLATAESWQQLLGEPTTQRRRGRKQPP